MRLEQLRTSIGDALVEFESDPLLRRALMQSLGAIDTHLGRPRELPAGVRPNRHDRRGGPR